MRFRPFFLLILFVLLESLLACSFTQPSPLPSGENYNLPTSGEIFGHEGGQSKFPELFAKARESLERGDLEHAEEIYHQIISLEPDNPLGYVGVGSCRFFADDELAAEENYRKALELDPNSTGALSGMGAISYIQGNYIDAIEWYQKAIDLNHDLGDAHYGLGISYDATGQTELAIYHFDEFLKLAPDPNLATYARERVLELRLQ